MAMRFHSALRMSLPAAVFLAASMQAAQPQTAPAANALTGAQKQRLQAIEAGAGAKDDQFSRSMRELAKAFDRNILSPKPSAETDENLTNEIAGNVAQAVRMRMAVVRDMVKVLTPEQKNALLVELAKPDTNPDLAELIGKMFGSQQ